MLSVVRLVICVVWFMSRMLCALRGFRNSRLKLIPRILSGNFLVRKVVGDRPVMLGKAVQLTHYVGTSYIETDVDVNSSRVASYICRVALLQAQSNVLDIAFVLQATPPVVSHACRRA